MIASKNLKKQIIIEIIALIFLIGVIIYASFAIHKNNQNHVSNTNGFVTVVDDSKFKLTNAMSDGEGLSTTGITYAVTNNNSNQAIYKVLIIPSTTNKEVLNQIRISVDDLYVSNLTELESYDNGYELITHELKSGYTKNHLIKIWYKIGTNENIAKQKIDFDLKLSTN